MEAFAGQARSHRIFAALYLWEPGLPAMGCKAAPPNHYCYQTSNNQLRQFVFFSYNFPYILPAAS